MAYTVLARRYRPQSFDEVIGQEAVARTLRNAIAADRVAHGYLFTGTRGVGKTTMARLLAKALNCEKGPTPDPCGKCDSCLRTHEGDDIDVIEIDGASNTGVDSVRELRAGAIFAPARSRFKIYIIDEVHMLSTPAFNALLKTLEEPPPHVKFIFATTDPQKVPPTIHSRCQRFDFRSVPTETIAAYLAKLCKKEKVKAEPDALRVIAREGRGSVRDALTLLDQSITLCAGDIKLGAVLESLGLADSQRYFDLLDAVAAGDLPQALKLLDQALAEGSECGELLDHLLDHLRSLLLVTAAGPDAPGLEVTADERQKLVQQAARFSADQLTLAVELVGEARYRVRSLPHGRPLVELAVIQLARMPDFASIKETLAQLASGGGAAAGAPAAGQGSPLRAPEAGEKKKPVERPVAAPPLPNQGGSPPARQPAPAQAVVRNGPLPDEAEVGEEIADEPPADVELPARDAVGASGPPEPAPQAAASAATGAAPGNAHPASSAAVQDDDGGPLSAAEQERVRGDPTVRRILELFDGRIVDMRRTRKD